MPHRRRPPARATGSLAVSAASAAAEAPTAERPSVLFIYLDDFGLRDCGFMGSDYYETPHLDRLARQGMVFTDAYSCAANCAPARACYSRANTPRGTRSTTWARGAGASKSLVG